MSMIKSLSLEKLVKQKSSWLEAEESHGPVISSRVRLARNINAYHFPGWAKEEQHRAVWQQSVDLFTFSCCVHRLGNGIVESLRSRSTF